MAIEPVPQQHQFGREHPDRGLAVGLREQARQRVSLAKALAQLTPEEQGAAVNDQRSKAGQAARAKWRALLPAKYRWLVP